MISALNVLNTVTALGTDVSVDSTGMVNFCGLVEFPAINVQKVAINNPVAAVAGVITITPTATDSTLYSFNIVGTSKATGIPKTMIVTYTSGVGATATTICNAFRTIINADSDFSIAATGTATLILTSATGTNPDFTVGGTSNSITSVGSASATTIYPNLSAVNTTAGVSPIGTVAQLQTKYGYTSNPNAVSYPALANLTTGYYYTEVIISYNDIIKSSSNGFNKTVATKDAVLLVQQGTTAGTVATTNYNDLLGTYGTITGLAAGYKVSIALMTGTAGALSGVTQTVTSGTLASASDVMPGDYIISVTTPVVAKVVSVASDTTFISSSTTALTSASTLNLAKWRNIPL